MIKVNNLNKSYKNKVLFKKACLSLPSKGLFLLLGNNGVGKSTFLDILSYSNKEYEGTIEIDSFILSKEDDKKTYEFVQKKIAYIDQKNNLVSFLSPYENLNLSSLIYKNEEKNDLKIKRKKIAQLSDGEKICLVLDRALNEKKKIILLDEVTSSLDKINFEASMKKIEEISTNCLVILATHDNRIDEDKYNKVIIERENFNVVIKTKNEEKISDQFEEKRHKFPLKISLSFFKKHWVLNVFCSIILSFCIGTALSIIDYYLYDLKGVFLDTFLNASKEYNFNLSNEEYLSINGIEAYYENTYISKEAVEEISSSLKENASIMCRIGATNVNIDYQNTLEKDAIYISQNLASTLNSSFLYIGGYKIPYEVYRVNNLLMINKNYFDTLIPDYLKINCLITNDDFNNLNYKSDIFKDCYTYYFKPLSSFDVDIELLDNQMIVSNKLEEKNNVEFLNTSNFYKKSNEIVSISSLNIDCFDIKHEEIISLQLADNEIVINDKSFLKLKNSISYCKNINITNISKSRFYLSEFYDIAINKYEFNLWYSSNLIPEDDLIDDINSFLIAKRSSKKFVYVSFTVLLFIIFIIITLLFVNYKKNRYKKDFILLERSGLSEKQEFLIILCESIMVYLLTFVFTFIIEISNLSMIGIGPLLIYGNLPSLLTMYQYYLFHILLLIFTVCIMILPYYANIHTLNKIKRFLLSKGNKKDENRS